MSYAKNTKIDVFKTQGDILGLLRTHKANRFLLDWEENRIGFQINGRSVLMKIEMPNRNDKQFNYYPSGKEIFDDDISEQKYKQGIKSRWRALYLIIKAKFVAIESGVSTIDNEFMPHFILKNGRTLSEHILPQLDQPDMFPKLPEEIK